MKTTSLLAILFAGCVLFAVSQAYAATLTVNSLTDDPIAPTIGTTTLRDAITQANLDEPTVDTIMFSVTGTITLAAALPTISFPMTIQGPGASSLIIDGQGANQAFYINIGGYGASTNVSISCVTIQNCIAENGGAVYSLNSGAIISNCAFNNDTSTGSNYNDGGGAIYNGYGTLDVTDCTFIGNTAIGDGTAVGGGAVYDFFGAEYNGVVAISNCAFTGNSAPNTSASYEGGGAVYDYLAGSVAGAGLAITDCAFDGNSTGYCGGAIFTQSNRASVTNCTFAGNSAIYGGAIGNANVVAYTNCTCSGNVASFQGGAVYDSASLTAANCIFYGDTAANDFAEQNIYYLTYSDVEGVNQASSVGPGNISADPDFIRNPGTDGDTDYGDLDLLLDSPCIGAGNESNAPSFDFDGNSRPNPPSMGAYEYVPLPRVAGLIPASVTVGPSTQTIEVYGSGFYADGSSSTVTSVTIGGTAATSYDVVSGGLIVATVPTAITSEAGVYVVVVNTSNGATPEGPSVAGLTLTPNTPGPATFEFTVNPNPVVTGVSPTTIPATRGLSQTITVDGSGFLAGHAATDAGLSVTATVDSVTYPIVTLGTVADDVSITDSQLTFSLPNGNLTTPGSFDVQVTGSFRGQEDAPVFTLAREPDNDNVSTPIVTSPASSADLLDVAAAPTVGSVAPASITATTDAQTVTVNGTGFYGGGSASNVSSVAIGGVAAVDYYVLADTQLIATVPASKADAVGVYDVQVTTGGGASTISDADEFTVTAATGSSASSPVADPQTVGVPFNGLTAITLTGSDTNSPVEALTYSVATEPAHGTLTGTTPNLTFTPTVGYHGTDSFTFTVENAGSLTSAPATVTLNVAAGAPTANALSYNVSFGTAANVTLAGSDPNSPAEELSYALDSLPAHGTLSGTAPNLTYTPSAGFSGTDSFTFTAENASGLTSDPGIVTLTVATGAPTANGQTVGVALDAATNVTLTGTDPNLPAESLTYSVATEPVHGSLSGAAPNLTFTPTAGYSGTDSFTFAVENSSGLTSTPATVALNVAVGAPTANPQTFDVTYNTSTPIAVTGTDSNSPPQALTYTLATGPAHGTLTGTAPSLIYSPNLNYTGSDSFTFTVKNASGVVSAPATAAIVVSAGTPTANGQTLPVPVDTPTDAILSGLDPNSPRETLTYSITSLPAHGALSGTAPVILYTPLSGYNGTDSFTFTVTNTSGLTSSPATVTLNVTTGVHAFSAGLAMISLPTDYTGQPLSAVLGYASPVLAVWDPTADSYAATPTSPANSLVAGPGYWVRFPATETIASLGTAPASPFSIELSTGWNMIGCPQLNPVQIGTLNVVDSANVQHTYANAVTGGLVQGLLYTWQSTDTEYEVIPSATGSLTPYEGYWLYAYSPCTLSFPAGTGPPAPAS